MLAFAMRKSVMGRRITSVPNNYDMTDDEKRALTPEERKAKGWFTGGDDPRRSPGNNARRTKSGKTVTSMARQYTEEALDFLVESMRDPNIQRKIRQEAALALLARGWGNPKDSIMIEAAISHDHVARIDPSALTFEARQQILAAFNHSEKNNPVIDVEPILIEDAKGSDE